VVPADPAVCRRALRRDPAGHPPSQAQATLRRSRTALPC
jgi:hypothetical protein